MTDERYAMTLRLDPEQAAELEAIARVQGIPVSQAARAAIAASIEAKRSDPEFQARLRVAIARDRAILDRLAQ